MKPVQKQGLILTTRLIPGYQIAALLEYRGWHVRVEHDIDKARPALNSKLIDILVIDINDDALRSSDVLTYFKTHRPVSYVVALIRNGSKKTLYNMRSLGVDGFFLLNRSGYGLDTTQGLAPYFLASINAEYNRGRKINLSGVFQGKSSAIPSFVFQSG